MSVPGANAELEGGAEPEAGAVCELLQKVAPSTDMTPPTLSHRAVDRVLSQIVCKDNGTGELVLQQPAIQFWTAETVTTYNIAHIAASGLQRLGLQRTQMGAQLARCFSNRILGGSRCLLLGELSTTRLAWAY